MKNRIIFSILFLTVVSCLPKKNKDVEPDLAGTYQVSRISIGSTTVNYPDGNGTSANAVITRPSDSQINVTVIETENGKTSTEPYGTFTIRKASGKEYDILSSTNSVRIGSINGTDFTLDFTSSGKRYTLIARK
ncbi:hypothetical protein [Spirosoma pollinicola]|uniref:Lipocalin-like domain-containing protein n=1 Tax=Spirosoma pollinicola TaxID=2057025 RepID=A0A2K8YVI7_9BACT|nr:hypothetical protein [Spirosoma pollinicola]AUD01642.1 hypothetical protein CWM47_07305 [Spirosoma pollinicola]